MAADRNDRPQTPPSTTAADAARLVTLDDTDDLEIADGYPDPRGWDVMAGGPDGTKVGDVDKLLVDPVAQRVRYLVVKLDHDVVGGSDDRKVLLPVGVAQLDDDDDKVLVAGRGIEFFTQLPTYDADRFNRAHEDQLRERVAGAPIAAQAGRDYYDHEHYDESRLFRPRGETNARADVEGGAERRIPRVEEELDVTKRRAQVGEVDIRKRVETEHVEKEVPISREEVQVERRPVEARTADAGDLKEGEIRIPLMGEEAVVEKRPVVREELVIRKRVVQATQTVDADLRRERIDVDRDVDRNADRDVNRDLNRDVTRDANRDVSRAADRGSDDVRSAGDKLRDAAHDAGSDVRRGARDLRDDVRDRTR